MTMVRNRNLDEQTGNNLLNPNAYKIKKEDCPLCKFYFKKVLPSIKPMLEITDFEPVLAIDILCENGHKIQMEEIEKVLYHD